MGFDIAIITKEKTIDSHGKLTNTHYLLDRGFCTMIMNAKNHSEPILNELEKTLKTDLSFLLKPEYYNPQKFTDAEQREMGIDEEYIIQSRTERPSGFVSVKHFLNDLNNLIQRIEEQPEYESKMNYDRHWWNNYFSIDLQNDLKSICAFLVELNNQGQTEFSFDIN